MLSSPSMSRHSRSEVSVGRFLLGFIVAIVIVIFIVVQCAQGLF